MYNIKLIPYLALYKYMFTLLHRGQSLLWKVYDFGDFQNNIQLFLWYPPWKATTIVPKSFHSYGWALYLYFEIHMDS